MTSEITLAFSHPEARARATEGDVIPDRISLRDHIASAEIGAFQQERGREQRLCFNIVVELEPITGIDDDVDRVVSYDRITEAIAAELAGERLNLLETLAEKVAARVLAAPRALRVFVRIEKLDLGPGALGVEIVRTPDNALRLDADDHAHPVVIFLSNEAASSPLLIGWLDEAEAHGVPVIFCVDEAAYERSKLDHKFAQRRIDLLAIEQNAWVLASRDDRCVVTASRTELDWAAKHGRVSVWAPSKMVLDAHDRPPSADPHDLLGWFAEEVRASRVISVGQEIAGADCLDANTKSLL